MRILVVSQYFYPENFALNEMCFELVRRGHEVHVLTGQPNYGFGKIPEGYENLFEEEVNGVKIRRVKVHPRKGSSLFHLLLNYYSFWKNAKKAARKLKGPYDVIYSMSFSPLIGVEAANLAKKRLGIKNALHVLDLWPASPVAVGAIKEGSLAYRFLYRWSKKIYQGADELFLSSPSFNDYIKDVLKLDMPTRYIVQPALTVEPNEEVAFPDDCFNLVYCGNIGKLQLVDSLVEAIALLPKDIKVCLHIYGGGSHLDAIKALIEKNTDKIDGRIKIYGRVEGDESSAAQIAADALVVTLNDDGSPVSKTLPNKLLTSLYHEKPILGVIGGDGRKVLEESGGAILAVSQKPEDIAKAIEELTRLPKKELSQMGKANRAYYDSNFSFSMVMDEVENELTKLSRKG